MENITVNSVKAWLLATRPKTLTGAATPVLLGCGLACYYNWFNWTAALLCFLFAFAMQIDANLINDLFDFKKGSDREDRLGPKRACAEGWITVKAMIRGIALTTVTACAIGCGLLFYGGLEMIPIGLLCVVFAFLYTTGPYPLAYHGFGDILVLVFFGFIPVGCTFYVMTHSWNIQVGVVSLASGLVIDTLLMVNNYRDREQDALSNKKTIVVRLGEKAGEKLYLWLGIVAYILCISLVFFDNYLGAILPILYLLLHISTWKEMVKIKRGKELNRILGKTSRNMLLFAILLTLGLILNKEFLQLLYLLF